MTPHEQAEIIQLSVPVQPLRRRRLGEPAVRIELVVIDSDTQLGKGLLHRQAAVVKEASSGSPITQPATYPTIKAPGPKHRKPVATYLEDSTYRYSIST